MQISLCDEMEKMFYNEPHYRWDRLRLKFVSEYDMIEEMTRFTSDGMNDGIPPFTANSLMAIFDMCKLSR